MLDNGIEVIVNDEKVYKINFCFINYDVINFKNKDIMESFMCFS